MRRRSGCPVNVTPYMSQTSRSSQFAARHNEVTERISRSSNGTLHSTRNCRPCVIDQSWYQIRIGRPPPTSTPIRSTSRSYDSAGSVFRYSSTSWFFAASTITTGTPTESACTDNTEPANRLRRAPTAGSASGPPSGLGEPMTSSMDSAGTVVEGIAVSPGARADVRAGRAGERSPHSARPRSPDSGE